MQSYTKLFFNNGTDYRRKLERDITFTDIKPESPFVRHKRKINEANSVPGISETLYSYSNF